MFLKIVLTKINYINMKNSLFKYAFLSISFSLFFACGSGGDDGGGVLSNQNQITGFMVSGVSGAINNTENTVIATITEGTLTSLSPVITVSAGATISPASGTSQDFSSPVIYTVTAENGSTVNYTVTITTTIFSFTFDGTSYEVVKEAMNWRDAAAFAVSRGGVLAEINSREENNAVFSEVVNNAGINIDVGVNNEIWIGGNDFETEGVWILDGDNDGNGPQFWEGGNAGMFIGGLFSAWGEIEPDDAGGQDALTLILRDSPFNFAGQWNDRSEDTPRFFIVELNN